MKTYVLTLVALVYTLVQAQNPVTITPTFATQYDNVTITYDASLGNAELLGVSTVYCHTGVITNSSSSMADWQNVQGNWGTADANVLMTSIGNNQFQITYNIQNFYGLSAADTVQYLAFVFRNQDGSLVGRNADGSDIYVAIYPPNSFSANFTSPSESQMFALTDDVKVKVEMSDTADVDLFVNGNLAQSGVQVLSDSVVLQASALGAGYHVANYVIDHDGTIYEDSVGFNVQGAQVTAPSPSGVEDGVNIVSATEAVFQILAPNKDFVYLIGDFNNWQIREDYRLNLTPNDSTFWIEVDNLDPNGEYRFQFVVGSEQMRVADVYSALILDPMNDDYIPSDVFPNMPEYPTETSEIVGYFEMNPAVFNWTDQNYERPNSSSLMVYELLVRDYQEGHNYTSILDSLWYLKNLGVNAIELMPVNEFEGNISWGYNPDFYFSPDKYYGSPEMYKSFVDECHANGIAVIMDIALNHSFGQNPQVRMYFDPNAGQWGEPTAENPWFNQQPKHDFNVGYDYNHESKDTKYFVKRVLRHWVEEYHIDGYRMDLSKGFTQNNTLGNVGAWGQYDQSRIDILTDYANTVWSVDAGAYFILEHFADNSEETVLANSGMMLWGNMAHAYQEASMGYSADLSWQDYQNRGWNDPNLIAYATSHDEERLMYKCLNFGNSTSGYDIQDFTTALSRMELSYVFLFGMPGPKMIWQFDEVGYDYPINYCEDGSIDPDCRTSPKPIRWDYIEDSDRVRVFNLLRGMMELRKEVDSFNNFNYDYSLDNTGKYIAVKGGDTLLTMVGNFGVTSRSVAAQFDELGTWYDVFSGDSIDIQSVNQAVDLGPGEYRVLSNIQLPVKSLTDPIEVDIPMSVEEEKVVSENMNVTVYPNPSNGNIYLSVKESGRYNLTIFDIDGRVVYQSPEHLYNYPVQLDFSNVLGRGMYLIKTEKQGVVSSAKFVVD